MKAGAAHIAFSALSRIAVREFYTAALTAGGRPHGSPALRNEETGYFNAAVLDFDGNSIEVVFHENGANDAESDAGSSVVNRSRVLTWRRTVSDSLPDDRSIASTLSRATKAFGYASEVVPSSAKSALSSAAKSAIAPASEAPAPAPSAALVPTSSPAIPAPTTSSAGDSGAKKIIGTLLGAAAGAAVAYAMVKGEEDSARDEAAFAAATEARRLQQQIQSSSGTTTPAEAPRPSPLRVLYSVAETESAGQASAAGTQPRAIEAPPVYYQSPTYQSPTYQSVAPSQTTYFPAQQAIEYIPASSYAPSAAKSYVSAPRSSSDASTIKARSTADRSTLIGSFVPSEISNADRRVSVDRRSSAGSVHSVKSVKSSRSKSVHSSATKQSSGEKSVKSSAKSSTPSRSPSEVPLPSSKGGSKAGSIIGSILGRDQSDHVSEHDSRRDSFVSIKGFESPRLEELRRSEDDLDTVVPSDSISNAGSSSRRSRRSSHSGAKSTHSSHSKHSKHSKSSKHGSSRVSSSSKRSSSKTADVVTPAAISEAGSTSTVKPIKRSESKKGSVASLPIRPSSGSSVGGRKRSVVSYALG
jgi:hypothetical protein